MAKKVLSTDDTYLPEADRFIGNLSTVKDSSTKEILAYYVADRLKLDISLNVINLLANIHGATIHEDAFICWG